ncbi:MAG: SoxR reducing system RseC family protein [Desulfobacterales bacterium]
MATEEGIVTHIVSRDIVQVKTVRSSACKACSARHSCKPGETQEMNVEVLNPLGAKPGDRVVLTFDTGNLLKATFLLYILPIAGLLAGAIVGNHLGGQWSMGPGARSGLSALIGFGGLFLTLLFVRKKGNQLGRQSRYRPRVTRILRSFPAPLALEDCQKPIVHG